MNRRWGWGDAQLCRKKGKGPAESGGNAERNSLWFWGLISGIFFSVLCGLFFLPPSPFPPHWFGLSFLFAVCLVSQKLNLESLLITEPEFSEHNQVLVLLKKQVTSCVCIQCLCWKLQIDELIVPETKGQTYLTDPGFKAYYSLKNVFQFISFLYLGCAKRFSYNTVCLILFPSPS